MKRILLAFIAASAALPAFAADRWEIAGSGAVAILPTPKTTNGIESGSLYCAEQKWGFLFRTAPGVLIDGTQPAKITISGTLLPLEASVKGATATIPLPKKAIEPLKTGNTLAVEIGPVETGATAIFNLRGSQAAIELVAPKCSQVDMSAFTVVSLSETDPAVDEARTLAAEEMKVFAGSTGKQPTVRARLLALADQKNLLFAAVCGSTNYYGPSGCNLTGYSKAGAETDWRQVYNTEGMLLHTDPNASNGGWPNLVTLPVTGGTEPVHWIWTGERYELRDVIIAGDHEEHAEGDKTE